MNESPEPETLSPEMESTTTTFSQVVFMDVPRSYTPNTNVTCCYILTAGLQPNPRDWIGVFKVGWSSTQNYHNYVWVEPCLDRLGPDPVRREVVFDAYYLPKDDGDYQFCYVDSNGQVRGASTPFCFENPHDHTLYTSLENDILVISTKEQTEEMEKEREELHQELEELKEGKQIIQNELDERLKEIRRLRLTIEEMKNTMRTHAEVPGGGSTDVVMEQSCHEEDAMSDSNQLKESFVQFHGSVEEKYEKALQKISQLKQQRKELLATTEEKQTEITQLNSKMKEMEQDLSRLQDNIQLLQVDLQSSQKENRKLCAEAQQLEALKRDLVGLRKENETLHASRLPQGEDESSAKLQMEALLSQLQDTRVQLRQELQGANEARKRADTAERELGKLRAQLEQRTSLESGNKPQSQDSSLEAKLREAQKTIDDQAAIMDLAKLKQDDLESKLKKALRTIEDQETIMDLAKEEQENLVKRNQELQTEVDVLKGELAQVKPGTPAGPDFTQLSYPSFSSFPDSTADSQQNSLIYGNPYEYPEGASEVKVPQCQHCLTSFPGVSREELAQHEDSHKVCPICTLICDEMDQQQFEDHVYTHDL